MAAEGMEGARIVEKPFARERLESALAAATPEPRLHEGSDNPAAAAGFDVPSCRLVLDHFCSAFARLRFNPRSFARASPVEMSSGQP
jgi:hypothetical protein